MQEKLEKVWYYEKWIGRHVSFPPRRSVNLVYQIEVQAQINVQVGEFLRINKRVVHVDKKLKKINLRRLVGF